MAFASNEKNLIQKELATLKEEKESLKTKIASDSLEFKEVAIFCRKTIQIQEDEIRRLEEIIQVEERRHKEKILDLQQQNNENIEQLQKELERMKGEHLLMTTQIGNQQQMELEMVEMKKQLEDLRKELTTRDQKLNLREIREREIALKTEKRVRDEIQKEFDSEIAKISKQLRIQNAAQIEANLHIINKLNKEIETLKIKIQTQSLKIKESAKELGEAKKETMGLEADKKRLEEHLNKSRQTTEKMVKDSKKQIEESEKLRAKENARNLEIISNLKKDLSETKTTLKQIQEKFAKQEKQLNDEINLREQVLSKHLDQNQKLNDLQEFLQIILEENNDEYVDAMLGENRVAVFAKLSMLLQRIPLVQ